MKNFYQIDLLIFQFLCLIYKFFCVENEVILSKKIKVFNYFKKNN